MRDFSFCNSTMASCLRNFDLLSPFQKKHTELDNVVSTEKSLGRQKLSPQMLWSDDQL